MTWVTMSTGELVNVDLECEEVAECGGGAQFERDGTLLGVVMHDLEAHARNRRHGKGRCICGHLWHPTETDADPVGCGDCRRLGEHCPRYIDSTSRSVDLSAADE